MPKLDTTQTLDQFRAFDYEKQAWVTGLDAIKARIRTIEESLNILHGPEAEEYLNLIGLPASAAPGLILRGETELLELKGWFN